ncbi:hypothetical protein C1X05_15715 [Laceyella sacchari]|nr:hypothetical protein C1X05_15715 [Laceyella sacchari]
MKMPALVTLQEVKEYLKLDLMSQLEDKVLQHLIAAATAEVEQKHGRGLTYRETVETHSGTGDGKLFLRAYPVVSISSVTVNGAEVPPSAYRVEKHTGILHGAWPAGVDNISVSYKAGYWTDFQNPPPSMDIPMIPMDLKHECLELVAYLYENRGGVR